MGIFMNGGRLRYEVTNRRVGVSLFWRSRGAVSTVIAWGYKTHFKATILQRY